MADLTAQLETLFQETWLKHHEAYAEAGGDDPDWAAWYAAYLVDRLPAIVDVDLTKGEIAGLMENLAKLQPLEGPEIPWARFYAEFLTERYGIQG